MNFFKFFFDVIFIIVNKLINDKDNVYFFLNVNLGVVVFDLVRGVMGYDLVFFSLFCIW